MSARRAQGFTLIEVVVALAILASLVGLTLQNMKNTVRGRDEVLAALARPKVANAILSQIVKDLRYLWYGGLTGNAGFVGRGTRVGAYDADRFDFVTARLARSVPLDEENTDEDAPQAALSEVGYALRQRDDGAYNELWRREDPYVDDDPTNGGSYSLIYDRVRDFNLTFFERPGMATDKKDNKGVEEWDSRIKKRVPYAIILQMTFDAVESDDPREEGEPERIVRIFLLKPGGTAAVDWPASAAPASGAAMQ